MTSRKIATPTTNIQNALDVALSAIKRHNPNVPSALAVIIAEKKGAHGTFTPDSWQDNAGEHSGSARHEIKLNPVSFSLGAEQVLTTLIHECGHALAHATGIKDTSRQGRFHNTKFREIATKMGLVTEEDSSIGTRTPDMMDSTKALYAKEIAIIADALTTFRKPTSKAKAKKTTVRVGCSCGNPVTVPIKWFEEVMSVTLPCDICGEYYEAV